MSTPLSNFGGKGVFKQSIRAELDVEKDEILRRVRLKTLKEALEVNVKICRMSKLMLQIDTYHVGGTVKQVYLLE